MIARPALVQRLGGIKLQIAGQRQSLGHLYGDLETPLHYADLGLAGLRTAHRFRLAFLVVPVAARTAFWFFGGKRRQAPGAGEEKKKGKAGLFVWAGRAWQAYRLYRKFSPFLA